VWTVGLTVEISKALFSKFSDVVWTLLYTASSMFFAIFFLFRFQLGDHLCTEVLRSSPTSRQERQNLQIKEACQGYPSVKLLLQR